MRRTRRAQRLLLQLLVPRSWRRTFGASARTGVLDYLSPPPPTTHAAVSLFLSAGPHLPSMCRRKQEASGKQSQQVRLQRALDDSQRWKQAAQQAQQELQDLRSSQAAPGQDFSKLLAGAVKHQGVVSD